MTRKLIRFFSDPGSSASSPDSSNSSLTELKAVIIERDPQPQELPNPSQVNTKFKGLLNLSPFLSKKFF